MDLEGNRVGRCGLRDQWRAVVNMVMKLLVPYKAENFLNS
jgi:hypothetical protein